MTKLVLDFRRGKRKISMESTREDIQSNAADLEILFDRKNPIAEEDFVIIVSQLRFFLNKMGASILGISNEEVEIKLRSFIETLEDTNECAKNSS